MTGKVPWEASESTVTNIERRPSSLPRAAAHLSTHAYPQSSTLTLQCLLCRVWLSSSERRLGGALCVDLSTDDEKWDVGVERLIEEIREVTHGEVGLVENLHWVRGLVLRPVAARNADR